MQLRKVCHRLCGYSMAYYKKLNVYLEMDDYIILFCFLIIHRAKFVKLLYIYMIASETYFFITLIMS